MDEQTRRFLEQSRAKSAPAPGSIAMAEFRAAAEAFRPLGFDFEPVHSAGAAEIPLEHGSPVSARVYVPDGDGPLPVVVWAHGGAWVRNTVELLDHHFRVYANRGTFVVVAVDYSLSPEAPFPTALEEVYATGRWVRGVAEERGWDPRCIGIAGESSGGNLAAAAALLDRDRGEVGFALQALIVPLLDATFSGESWGELGDDYLLPRAQLEWAVEQYAPGVERTDPLLSPIHAPQLAGLPPAVIVTGEYDPLRDDGERYTQRLEAAGVPVAYRRCEGLIHHAPMVPRLIDRGRWMLEETAREIGSSLRAGLGRSGGSRGARPRRNGTQGENVNSARGRLAGKRALITGTNRGQGRAALELFAREGAAVAGCGKTPGVAEQVAEELRAEGLDVRARTVELSDAAAAADWVEWAVSDMGGCDIVYNNAGMGAFGGLADMALETWHEVIDVDLNAVFYVTRTAWPHLTAAGGSIINTASVAGMMGLGAVPSVALVAAKGAIIALTRQLAVEGAPHAIRANTITPGYVQGSPETIALVPPDLRERLIDDTLLKRAGRVEDVVSLALFLASDESTWITGTNVPVDGGWTAGQPK